MMLRVFLKIVEEFHLNFGTAIPGSTISIGGEEEKKKIITELKSLAECASEGERRLQGTEDATKWNECISPLLFNLVHNIFFCEET